MGKQPPRPPTKPRLTPEGRWLTEQRLRFGKRQSDIAQLFDCHPGRICEWEKGDHPIPDEEMCELRAYFQNLENNGKKSNRRRMM